MEVENKHKDYSKYDQIQLEKGTKIEMEHTDDEELAKQIASDHLDEFEDYYKELPKMEDKMKKKESHPYDSSAKMMFGKEFKNLTPQQQIEAEKNFVKNSSEKPTWMKKESTDVEENAKKMFGKGYKDLTPEQKKKVDDAAMVSHWLGENLKEKHYGLTYDEISKKKYGKKYDELDKEQKDDVIDEHDHVVEMGERVVYTNASSNYVFIKR